MKQNQIPSYIADGEYYFKEWLVIGPFFPADLDTDFFSDGEANIEPKEGDTVTTVDGRTLTWERYVSKRDVIDFMDAIDDVEDATAYAFCILESEMV
jgi:hypothetical protein